MENYDFRTYDKLPIFYFYKLRAKKFIFTNILGNLVFTIFIIAYVYKIFTKRKNYFKYMLLILELFNGLLTLFFISIYLRLSGFSKRNSLRILSFYFYYNIFYLTFFTYHALMFLFKCLSREIQQAKFEGWTVDDSLLVFSPLLVILILRTNHQYNYYFALKQIENN